MSTIKFMHLSLGQQFEYRGEHYTKVSPLIASNNADGKQKMIPRSAAVTIAMADSSPIESEASRPHPALEILERYHQTVLAEMQSLSDDEAKLGAARSRLEALRSELSQSLNQP